MKSHVGNLLPLTGVSGVLLAWELATRFSHSQVIPGPWAVVNGLTDLIRRGLLFKYTVASLYRVTWGYLAAVVTGIPFGLVLGWSTRGRRALNPIIQLLRPISPLAWIPISILWFGVGDLAAIYIIFQASFLPLVVTTMNAVNNVSEVHIRVGRNFGLSPLELIARVLYPAVVPQLIIGMRLALGVAWLVVVAAEMIAVNSGLGFLIVDSRNAGNRYDLVLAGMVVIGVVGFLLDVGMRKLEGLRSSPRQLAPLTKHAASRTPPLHLSKRG